MEKVERKQRYIDRLVLWLSEKILEEKLNNPLGYAFLFLSAVVLAFLFSKIGATLAMILTMVIVGGVVAVVCLFNAEFGFLFTLFSSFFIFIIKRYFGEEIPLGAVVEVLLFVTFLGIFFKKSTENVRKWQYTNNPVTIIYLIYVAYMIIQAFNPEMHSLDGWLHIMRKLLGFIMAYFVVLYVFNIRFLKRFVIIWIGLAFLAGLYGCYQEWFGLLPFEENWVRQDDLRFGLYFIEGRFRKFSFLSDPTAFGILMAISGLFALVLATGPVSLKNRIILIVASIIMFLGMAYSGTRTAYAMLPAGFAIFVIMTITHRNTMILTTVFLAVFVIIIFGPIYGNSTINRIRSTFEFSSDASLNVRDINRASIQPYIYDHPIGGGLATSGVTGLKYNPDHPLAGFPPDSGYLRTALETGWIGLILTCILYFIILRVSIAGYYRSRNRKVRTYYIGFITMFYSVIIAQYAQVAIGQLPGSLIFYPALAIVVCLQKFDKLTK